MSKTKSKKLKTYKQSDNKPKGYDLQESLVTETKTESFISNTETPKSANLYTHTRSVFQRNQQR